MSHDAYCECGAEFHKTPSICLECCSKHDEKTAKQIAELEAKIDEHELTESGWLEAEAGYEQREYRLKKELAIERRKVETLFQDEHSYNTMSVLEHLIAATEHLLNDHSCDQHGYEGWTYAMRRGKEILKEWATAKAKEVNRG